MFVLSYIPCISLSSSLAHKVEQLIFNLKCDNVNFELNHPVCEVGHLNIVNKKTQRLIEVAQMYYEQDLTQSEIAGRLHVSRPLVSRMIKEAREQGVVTIQIHTTPNSANSVLAQLRNFYDLRGGVLVPDAGGEDSTNKHLAASMLEFVLNLTPPAANIGIGWGYIIGMFTKAVENAAIQQKLAATVFPLIGNSSVSNRDYHSNEIVRVFAEKTGAVPIYIHAPAFLETEPEMRLFQESESFKKVAGAWNEIDTAIVNIGNYPSSPDYATATRFGDLLTTHRATGRMLCSYFDIHGAIIHSDVDYAIQIPLSRLARCRNVIAVCSAALQPRALVGALRTGLITHVIAAESVARQALEIR